MSYAQRRLAFAPAYFVRACLDLAFNLADTVRCRRGLGVVPARTKVWLLVWSVRRRPFASGSKVRRGLAFLLGEPSRTPAFVYRDPHRMLALLKPWRLLP